jgi:hypothetical protein
MFTGAQRWKNGIGALVTQEKKNQKKKLLLLNINATSNTQMKGEYGCNTLHPPHIIMGAQSCVFNAMKMTVMGSDAHLTTSLIREGGVHVPKEDITLPF